MRPERLVEIKEKVKDKKIKAGEVLHTEKKSGGDAMQNIEKVVTKL